MGIVLNETEWAKNMIQLGSLGRKPSETLSRVARYYIDNGYSKRDTRMKLDAFLLQCEPTASLPKWSDALTYAVNRASKYEAVKIDCIEITKPEIDAIDALGTKQIRRLAFTLLCLAKYWNKVVSNGDYWVNNKDNEIMSMANINTSIRRQGLMYWTLKEAGMIQFSRKVDNTNVKVCFVQDGEVVYKVTDLRNLGYQYLKYCGEPYFDCQNCGITTKYNDPIKGRKQKYCKTCATEITMKNNVNSVMKYRNTIRESSDKHYTVYMHESPNGKRYVGVTSTTLAQRWKGGTGYIDNHAFYSDILEFGWGNIIHYKAFDTDDESLAKDVESYLIHTYKTDNGESGYNRQTSRKNNYTEESAHSVNLVEVDGSGFDLM